MIVLGGLISIIHAFAGASNYAAPHSSMGSEAGGLKSQTGSGSGQIGATVSKGDFSDIAGDWRFRAFALSISSDGEAVANWECGNIFGTAPCSGGGRATLRFTSVINEYPTAAVLTSSQPSVFSQGKQYFLVLLPGGKAQLRGPQGLIVVMCGPSFDQSIYPGDQC
jgi:hypothetical protein